MCVRRLLHLETPSALQGYGASAVPADVPAYPQTEIWAGLVGLLDGSGIENRSHVLMTLHNSKDLAERLAAVEDRLAIYTLIASHPPSADTAAPNYTREVYLPHGVFDP